MTGGDEKLNLKDNLLVYSYEGQGSSAGSLGCCSNLESTDDLHFLDDVGPKFKTLAEICGGTKIETEGEQEVSALPPVSGAKIQTSQSCLVAAQQTPQPAVKLQSAGKVDHAVSETSERSEMRKESMAMVKEEVSSVKEGMGNQNSMFVMQQQQQPVYYTAAPMVQPMHYVVQPAFQNAMVLTEAPATNLQNMILVTGAEAGASQGILVQGQTVVSSPQTQGFSTLLKTGGTLGKHTNLIPAGNFSGSQTMLFVDGNVPAGSVKILNGSQAGLIQGGTVSGSQSYVMVGESTNGRKIQEAIGVQLKNEGSGSQKTLDRNRSTSTGSHNSASSTAVKTTSTIRKTVVQNSREDH